MSLPYKLSNLLYLVKMIRIKRAMNLLNIHRIMKIIKQFYKERLKREIRNNPQIKDDTTSDNNGLEQILIIYNTLKTCKLIYMIANCTYFIGMSWIIMCNYI